MSASGKAVDLVDRPDGIRRRRRHDGRPDIARSGDQLRPLRSMTRSTGPQIRAAAAAAMLRLSSEPVQCPRRQVRHPAALDFENVQRFAAELPLDGDSVIIADPAAGETPAFLKACGATIGYVEMKKLAKTVEGGRISMVALGALRI